MMEKERRQHIIEERDAEIAKLRAQLDGARRERTGERWELRWGSEGASDLGVYPHTSLFSWHKTADEARERRARDDLGAQLRLVHVRRYRLVRKPASATPSRAGGPATSPCRWSAAPSSRWPGARV